MLPLLVLLFTVAASAQQPQSHDMALEVVERSHVMRTSVLGCDIHGVATGFVQLVGAGIDMVCSDEKYPVELQGVQSLYNCPEVDDVVVGVRVLRNDRVPQDGIVDAGVMGFQLLCASGHVLPPAVMPSSAPADSKAAAVLRIETNVTPTSGGEVAPGSNIYCSANRAVCGAVIAFDDLPELMSIGLSCCPNPPPEEDVSLLDSYDFVMDDEEVYEEYAAGNEDEHIARAAQGGMQTEDATLTTE